MIIEKRGEEAIPELEVWANQIAGSLDKRVQASSSYHDADSNTYVLRFQKRMRIILFRLSEAQVHTPGREGECEKIVKGKVKELSG